MFFRILARDMFIDNILEFPPEILDNIWNFCDKGTLRSFACCSKRCYSLVGHIVFRDIEIRWYQIKKARKLLQEPLKFTRCLKFPEFGWPASTPKWKGLAEDARKLMSFCNMSQLKELSILHKVPDSIIQQILKSKGNRNRQLAGEFITLTSKSFSTWKNLQKLSLKRCNFLDEDLRYVVGLVELNITGCVGTNAMIDHIAQMEKLRRLTLCRIHKSAAYESRLPISLLKMVGLKSLEYLDICDSMISSEADLVTLLKSLKSLKVLNVSDIKLTLSLDVFCCLPLLDDLRMSGCDLSDYQLSSISKLKSLRSLDVGYNKSLTNIGLKYLGQLVSLVRLDIRGNKEITNDGIGHLISLVLLEDLNIDECWVKCYSHLKLIKLFDNISSMKT